MTATQGKTVALMMARKVITAQMRGTLTPGLQLSVIGREVRLKNALETDVKWVTKSFPGGTFNKYSSVVSKHERINGRRKKVFYQEHIYDVDLDNDASLSVCYLLPHTCDSYLRGTVKVGEAPVWSCTGCWKPVTKTRARKLGLIP